MKSYGNLRIVSDGNPKGTQVTVDGVEIKCVTSVSWKLDNPDGWATAVINVAIVEVDVMAVADIEEATIQLIPNERLH